MQDSDSTVWFAFLLYFSFARKPTIHGMVKYSACFPQLSVTTNDLTKDPESVVSFRISGGGVGVGAAQVIFYTLNRQLLIITSISSETMFSVPRFIPNQVCSKMAKIRDCSANTLTAHSPWIPPVYYTCACICVTHRMKREQGMLAWE